MIRGLQADLARKIQHLCGLYEGVVARADDMEVRRGVAETCLGVAKAEASRRNPTPYLCTPSVSQAHYEALTSSLHQQENRRLSVMKNAAEEALQARLRELLHMQETQEQRMNQGVV